MGRHRAARAAAPCPGVGWVPRGALRGWSALGGVWGRVMRLRRGCCGAERVVSVQ